LALEAGTGPWDLLDLYEEEHGDDDDGDDGGENAPTLDEVRDLLKSMRRKPRTQTA
jgi:hypothetical protein